MIRAWSQPVPIPLLTLWSTWSGWACSPPAWWVCGFWVCQVLHPGSSYIHRIPVYECRWSQSCWEVQSESNVPSWERASQVVCTQLLRGINHGCFCTQHPLYCYQFLCHWFPSTARCLCPHCESGEAGNLELFSDSSSGTQQELSCDLGFLTQCPAPMRLFLWGCCRQCRLPEQGNTSLPLFLGTNF